MNSDHSGWSCKAEDPNGTTLAKAQQNNGTWQLLKRWNRETISFKPTYEGQCYFSEGTLKLKIYVLDHYWHLKVAKNDVKLMSHQCSCGISAPKQSSPNSLDKDVNLAQKKNVFRGASFSVSCIVTKRVNSKNGCGSNMFVPFSQLMCRW